MTTSKAPHASGMAQGDHDLRRRNVSDKGETNGEVTAPRDEVDNKKAQKV